MYNDICNVSYNSFNRVYNVYTTYILYSINYIECES